MSITVAEAAPTFRQILIDALDDAFWYRRAQVEDCTGCPQNPAGICGDHQEDNAMARDYENARKQIEGSLAAPEWADELARLLPAAEGEK